MSQPTVASPILKVRADGRPITAAALVLHGGRKTGVDRVPPWALAYLRMRPFADALWRAGGASGLAVASLRHGVRGWNGDLRSPVADARWALEQLRDRFGDIDIALVGHSMGGRTAFAVADDPAVRAVVALAPWIEPEDRVEPLTGRTVLIAHGTLDRMTDPAASAAFAERARPLAKQISYVSVSDDRHAMLRRARLWHQIAAGFTVETLLDPPPAVAIGADAAAVVAQALAGAASIRV